MSPSGSFVDQPQRYPYQPALDGVRALAVTSVLLYHFGTNGFGGGFFGVDVFLVLSGYLITTLLLREYDARGRVSIAQFYARRARRLLPALFLVLGAVTLFGRYAADQQQLVNLRGDALSSLFYVANWRFIGSGGGYFELFSPSPLSHLWSLAIEEQWYLVLPIALVGMLAVVGLPVGRARRVWLGVVTIGAFASAGLMATLVNDADPNRVYLGTDTRAQALFVGTGLAVLLHARVLGRATQRMVDLAGMCGLAGLAVMALTVENGSRWIYRGGFALVAVLAAAVIAAAVVPERGVVRRLLALPPLPELGRISYGVYLWHWPVRVYLDELRTGLDGPALFIVRVAVTLLLSIASYELVERPIRQRAWRTWTPVLGIGVAVVAVTAMLVAFVPGPPGASAAVDAVDAGPGVESKGTRVLVVGDSVGDTLAEKFDPSSVRRRTSVGRGTIIGCGLQLPGTGCGHVLDSWRAAVEQFDPAVSIVVLGRWEAEDHVADGRLYQAGTKRAADLLSRQLTRGLRILTTGGRPVVLFTVQSCFAGGSPRYDPAAATWLNDLFRDVAAQVGPSVHLVDYARFICSGSRFGIGTLGDGLHLTEDGAAVVWRWLDRQGLLNPA